MVENISSKISEKPLNLTFFEQLFNLNLIIINKLKKVTYIGVFIAVCI